MLQACGTTGSDTEDEQATIGPGISLSDYREIAPITELQFVPDDLSGITYNYDSNSFYLIRNNVTTIWETTTSYQLIRTIDTVDNFGDSEDIVYLGNQEFAIVSEESVLYVGYIPPGNTDIVIDPADFQRITFAPDGGNQGPEGVAFDITTQSFFIVKEENPRKLYTFVRPASTADVTITPSEPFDAQTTPNPRLTQDMSGVAYNPATGRLLILSDRDHRVMDIALDGTVYGTLDFPNEQYEGIAFDGLGRLHLVGERHFYHVWAPM